MNYDIWVPGNHEFDFSMDTLTDMIGQHDCDVLCANVFYKDGSSIGDPYVILESDITGTRRSMPASPDWCGRAGSI